MANSVDPDEMARYEPSHLGLHYLHRPLCWSAVLNGLREIKLLGSGKLFFLFLFGSLLKRIYSTHV